MGKDSKFLRNCLSDDLRKMNIEDRLNVVCVWMMGWVCPADKKLDELRFEERLELVEAWIKGHESAKPKNKKRRTT
jgi:hypothetical protein